MTLVDYISTNPKIALVVGGIHLVASYSVKKLEIPTFLMQVLQCGAWSITITVGIITIYGSYKKWRVKK